MENLSYYLKAKNKKGEPATRYQPHELLVLYRERSGLSKLELARLLGFTSERMLQKWEGGYSLPIAARLKELVSLYLERKVFLPGREIEEANLLWKVIKDYHDATNPGFEAYPVFDGDWFSTQLQAERPLTPPSYLHQDHPESNLHPHNLATQLSTFIGRNREIQVISDLLAHKKKKLITLIGPGGIGKTRLALEVGTQLLEHYPAGVWLVELATSSVTELVLLKVAQVFGFREMPGQNLEEMLIKHLNKLSVLLILDNCEHLIQPCAQLAEKLLKACPRLQILATSREVLGVQGEISWPVSNLTLPETEQVMPEEVLLEYEAVRLFVDRATAVSPFFQLGERNCLILAQICRVLEGIPLALELAAARTRLLSLEQLSERLSSEGGPFQLLVGASRLGEERHRTLEALIDWSYALLNPVEKVLWQRLSIFPGDFSLEAAEQVCNDESIIPLVSVLDGLSQLVSKSLISVIIGERANRYRLLETLRHFARKKLQENGEETIYRARHLEFFTALVKQISPQLSGSGQVPGLELLELENNNIRAALEGYLASASPVKIEEGLKLVELLAVFWIMRGYFTEGRDWSERFLEAITKIGLAPSPSYAGVLLSSGTLALQQGDYIKATDFLEKSRSFFRQFQDKMGLARSVSRLGVIAAQRGDYTTATLYYQEGLELGQELGNSHAVADSLSNLGIAAFRQSSYQVASSYFQQSLDILKKLGNKQGQAQVLNNLGGLAIETESYTAARDYYLESLALKRELSNSLGITTTLTNLGEVSLLLGNYDEAELFFEEGYHLQQELHDRSGCAYSLHNLGMLALLQHELVKAGSLFGECLNDLSESGEIYLLSNTLSGIISLTCEFVISSTTRHRKVGLYLERATELRGAIEQLLTSTGGSLGRLEREIYRQATDMLLQQMEPMQYQTFFEKGKTLTTTKAIEKAFSLPFISGKVN